MAHETDSPEKPAIAQAESVESIHLSDEKRSGSSSPSHVHVQDVRQDPERGGQDDAFSHIDKKKVLRKMDLHLIPVLSVLYLLSFLDRGIT